MIETKAFVKFGIDQIDGRSYIMDNWLTENVGRSGWDVHLDGYRLCGIMFSKPEDAVAFKLRFEL